tara:strand:- start:23 stop:727 length:705 start_codon:yes stop_codon:yes gene_type:complete
MKKLLSLLVFTPFLILSQDHVEHNLIGWTIDNKIVYEKESFYFFNSNYEIIVQNLVTDKIEDIITIFEGGDGDCGNEFLDCPIYIDHNNQKTVVLYPYSIIDSISFRDSVKRDMFIDNFLKMYTISKKSISLYENKFIDDYDLNILLKLNEYDSNKTFFDVLVGNQKIGYKRIGGGDWANDITIRGYYMSPFESRALIVIETNTMHIGEEYYEGMENEMKLYYFGCNLNPSTFK